MAMGIVNFFVTSFRVTPFSVVDFIKLTSVAEIFTVYFNVFEIILIIFAIAICIAGAVLLAVKCRKRPVRKQLSRSLIALGCAGGGIALMFALGLGFGVLSLEMPQLTQAYDDYGFVYCFSVSIFDRGVEEPEEYSRYSTDDILIKISENQKPIGKTVTPNIIYVQLESFFDVNYLKNVGYSYNPVKNFEKLKTMGMSGLLTVPVVGAGTVNTEFEVLSGMSLDFFGAGEYPFKTVLQTNTCETVAYNLMELGYGTHFIHNYQGSFYDRNEIYTHLGFETFTSMEYMSDISYNISGVWPKDDVLTEQIISALDSTDGSDFVMAVTVQSHGKYPPNELPDGTMYKILTSFDDAMAEGGPSSIDALSYYIDQIYEVDQFIGQLYDAVMAYSEDTVLVLYGDHLPSLSISDRDLEKGSTMQTEYVIVSNFGIENNTEAFGDISAYQLSAKVLGMCGINNGILTKLHQNCSELTQYQIWLNTLEYDMLGEDPLGGDSLRHVYGGVRNYYPVTDMHMGLQDVYCTSHVYRDGFLCIYGEHFTSSSKIVLNDSVMDDTIFFSKRMLKLKIEPEELEDVTRFSIIQVSGADKILSSTPVYTLKIA